jgi:hypothetical protein
MERDVFQQCILDGTKEFVRVCTQLEHMTMEAYSFPPLLRVNMWIFLEHLNRLQRLKVLRVDLRFFDLRQEPPRNFQPIFPKLQVLHFLGYSDDTVLEDNLTIVLSKWKWPALEYLDLPRWSWTNDALKNMLMNAPHLVALDLQCAISPLGQVADAMVGKVFPRLKTVCVRIQEEGSIHKDQVVQMLQTACPHASIHISRHRCCTIHYGVHARLPNQMADVEPVHCDDLHHMSYDFGDYEFYDDDNRYNPYDDPYYDSDPQDVDDL